MAHELIDAVTNERIVAAVDRTLCLHAQRDGAPVGTLAWTAVEETFCTCVTGAEDAVEHHLSAIHAALVADVLQQAERRLGEPSQAGHAAQRAVLSLGWRGPCLPDQEEGSMRTLLSIRNRR